MRDFLDVLTDIDSGEVHRHASEELAAVVAAVKETHKVGTLTLTINVKPEGDMMIVRGEIKSKIPKAATNSSMFYATDDGELRRDDPRQLPLKNVPKAPERLRVLKEKRAEEKEALDDTSMKVSVGGKEVGTFTGKQLKDAAARMGGKTDGEGGSDE